MPSLASILKQQQLRKILVVVPGQSCGSARKGPAWGAKDPVFPERPEGIWDRGSHGHEMGIFGRNTGSGHGGYIHHVHGKGGFGQRHFGQSWDLG